jgi:hypothetical protein
VLPAIDPSENDLQIKEGVAEWPYPNECESTVIVLRLEVIEKRESTHGGQSRSWNRQTKREISNAQGHYRPIEQMNR